MKKKLWAGRFKEATHGLVDEFNASISFDCRLFRHDIRGSLAHASALAKAGVLTRSEVGRITRGLAAVEKEMASGGFAWKAGHEDVHMAVEARLTELIGPL